MGVHNRSSRGSCKLLSESANEVEYQLLLAHDLTFLGPLSYERARSEVIEIKQMLNALKRKIQASTSNTIPGA